MSYRDIISDFDKEESIPKYGKGGETDPTKPKPTVQSYQAKDEADYKYRQQMYSDSLDLHSNYEHLKKELKNQGYVSGNAGRNSIEQALSVTTPEKIGLRKESETLNSVMDFIPGRINNTLPRQLYSNTIKPNGMEGFGYPKGSSFFSNDPRLGDARVIARYDNVKPVQQVLPPPGSNVQNSTQPNPVSTQPQRPVYQPVEKMPVRGLEADYDKQSSMNKRSVPVMEDNTEARPFTASNYLKHTDQPIGEWVSTLKGGKVIKEPMYSREQLEKRNKNKLASKAYGGYIDWTKTYK
jgi:hypothetical protein